MIQLYSKFYTTVKYIFHQKNQLNQWFIGAGEMNRTPDLLITNELLYRLSYTGNVGAIVAATSLCSSSLLVVAHHALDFVA